MKTFVIVGAGLAGAKAAQTLREEGFDGRLVLIGDEAELPYERPPLSKQYLLGDAPRDGAHVHPREFYAEQDIELLSGVTAARLRRAEGGVRRGRPGRGDRGRLDRLRGRRRGEDAGR
jgi:3-phenylpropionate/trans-cinnamate dioxygenase ferredoxin reductase subunit